eukprot:CAMPEP_0119000166 /NCGR_PEP_ID=MMETSP1173-20130426/63943_1 /TAXON_ID=1034831 /ORGANISM="Rhizochromulina marina cf, Strain CCMP1243" /LENGTH=233 /DNA_ID=CAMNT_0006951669 /DNA_START=290 /DNA_END=991 /DNA_ORIENTATION=+
MCLSASLLSLSCCAAPPQKLPWRDAMHFHQCFGNPLPVFGKTPHLNESEPHAVSPPRQEVVCHTAGCASHVCSVANRAVLLVEERDGERDAEHSCHISPDEDCPVEDSWHGKGNELCKHEDHLPRVADDGVGEEGVHGAARSQRGLVGIAGARREHARADKSAAEVEMKESSSPSGSDHRRPEEEKGHHVAQEVRKVRVGEHGGDEGVRPGRQPGAGHREVPLHEPRVRVLPP